MFKRLWFQSVSLVIVLVATGCATPKVETEQLVPARSPEASRLKRVAVLPFSGLNGADVTSDVETLLAGIVIQESRYFEVVERQRLSALMSELRLASTGVIDDSTASRLGKMAAANGIYLGRVTRNDASDQQVVETRQVCVLYEQKTDRRGNIVNGACQRWQQVAVRCTIRSAFFEFAPKLVSVESGAIVYARNHAGEAQAKSCAEPDSRNNQPLPDQRSLLSDARRKALDGFRLDVAPSTQTRSIAVLNSADRISSPPAKERFSAGVKFAGERRLDRACEIWQEIAATETSSPELAYNLGLCAESSGDLERALELYTVADRRLQAPNSIISAALARVRNDQQNRSKLSQQLRPEANQQTASTAPAASAASPATAPAGPVPAPVAQVGVAPAPVGLRPGNQTEPPTRETIERAQSRLNALGFQVGTPDGVAGNRTKQAIRQFQQSKRLSVTGELDAATLSALGIN